MKHENKKQNQQSLPFEVFERFERVINLYAFAHPEFESEGVFDEPGDLIDYNRLPEQLILNCLARFRFSDIKSLWEMVVVYDDKKKEKLIEIIEPLICTKEELAHCARKAVNDEDAEYFDEALNQLWEEYLAKRAAIIVIQARDGFPDDDEDLSRMIDSAIEAEVEAELAIKVAAESAVVKAERAAWNLARKKAEKNFSPITARDVLCVLIENSGDESTANEIFPLIKKSRVMCARHDGLLAAHEEIRIQLVELGYLDDYRD